MSLPIDVNAFLYMIRSCEHRFPNDVTNDACYEIFYGGTRFADLSDHPVITGELAPVALPEAQCKAAGLKSPCYSTAAGAYQFIRPTWTRLRNKLGLDDFGFANQDRAALELLDESGILSLIEQGEIESAIRKAGKVWASLPGNTYQQNPKAMRFALDRFAEGQRLYAQASGELPPLP
jgi:muramidase (phage lysozyme)